MIKKMRNFNLRVEDQLMDEIEKIAIEKFNDNTSESCRYLFKLGIELEKIKPHEFDQEKLEKITMELNQKIKDETFFEWLNSKTPDQRSAIKNMITIEEEERIKKESNLY